MSDGLDLRTAILPLPFNVRFWGGMCCKTLSCIAIAQ